MRIVSIGNRPTPNQFPQPLRHEALAHVAIRPSAIEANLDDRENEVQIGQCLIESFRLAQDSAQNSLFVRTESQELLADVGQSRIGIGICLRRLCDAP
jgi:hypothetical protein